MAHGVVRKVFVCFVQEGGHSDQAPVERVAIEFRIDRDRDRRDGSVDHAMLQVRSRESQYECTKSTCGQLSTYSSIIPSGMIAWR